jgi:hypothetical protein
MSIKFPRSEIVFREKLALTLGYFWLKCPICEQFYAGYECGKISVRKEGEEARTIACRWCDKGAK